MYSFYHPIARLIDGFGPLWASRYSLSDDTTIPGTWSEPINLLESDGKTVPTPNEFADVSATTVGDNLIILACAYASSPTNSTGGTYVAIYDTRDLDIDGNKWAAKWHDYLPSQFPDPSTDDFINVSVEWFSQIDPTAQKSDPPAYCVGVFVQPHVWRADVPYRPAKLAFYRMTIGDQAGSDFSVTLARLTEVDSSKAFFANLIRDPAGRLRTWISEDNKLDFQAVLFDVTVGEQGGSFGWNPSGASILVNDNAANKHIPFSLFFVFRDGKSQTTVNGQSATQYPVYEFVFYGGQGECQVNRCGTIQTIADFSVGKTKTDLKIPLNVISGIIDGPIPIPLENFKNYPTTGDAKGGSMIYGIEKEKDSSHQVSNTWSLGFESQGKMTAALDPHGIFLLREGRARRRVIRRARPRPMILP
jgi:hypothetical protein